MTKLKKVAKYQPVLSVKPTQFSVGMVEVEFKTKRMLKMSKRELRKLVDKHPVPVVLSPWNELCIIDHHHFVCACWHAKVKEVRVEVVKDYSKQKMSYVQFWKKLAKLNYAFLYDQFGDGPRSPLYLPSDIRGVSDDPYRSLAWIVRKEGGFNKSDTPFSEFTWAQFFRSKKLLLKHGKEGLKGMVGRGLRLAKSPEAKGLPGYLSKAAIDQAIEKQVSKTQYIESDVTEGPMATAPKIIELKPEEVKAADSKKDAKKGEDKNGESQSGAKRSLKKGGSKIPAVKKKRVKK